MSAARRLLLAAAAGGAGFPVPPIGSVTLTSAPDGGMNQLVVPGAFTHGGVTTIGYVDGSGNVEAIEWNGSTSGPHTIHASFEADAHDSPAIVRRASDGRLIVAYSKHNNTPFNVRVSTNADDPSAWGSATDIDSQLGGTRYTDHGLWEVDSTLYLVVRDEPSAGTDSRWVISTAAASVPTSGWAAQTILYRVASERSYVLTHLSGSVIHFVVTNGSSTGFSKLGHFYLDTAAGTYHRSDGTDITADVPLDFSDVTEIATGTALFPWNIVVDGSGYPVVAARDGLDYEYIRWNGAAWSQTTVASSGTGYEYNGPATGFIAYGACIDDGRPDDMYVIEDVSSQPEVARYRTADGGATFSRRAVTTGSSGLKVQLICVRDPLDGGLRAFWMEGTWTDYEDWSTGLAGVVD